MAPEHKKMDHRSSWARSPSPTQSSISPLSYDSPHFTAHESRVSSPTEDGNYLEPPIPPEDIPRRPRPRTPPMPPPRIKSIISEAGPSRHPIIYESPLSSPARVPRNAAAPRRNPMLMTMSGANNAVVRKPQHPPKMFSLGENSRVLGAGHLALNALRALTMVTLLVVMTASWAMVVLSILKRNFDLFDTFSHFFLFGIAVVLFLSELNLKFFRGWYARNWPVLTPEHSLAWLGLAMIIIGCQVLGDLVKPAYDPDTIGYAFWRCIVAAGILSLTFGVFNIVASIVFRVPERHITARRIRSHGSLAPHNASSSGKSIDDGFSQDFGPAASSTHRDNFSARSYFKEVDIDGREEDRDETSGMKRLTRVFNPKNYNFRRSRIQISKPIPQDQDLEHGSGLGGGSGYGGLDRASPILPGVQRPPTGLHPAFKSGDAGRDRAPSLYSEAHMSRF